MLIEHGLPLDYVSKRLGHSSIYTTANVYDTVTDKREKLPSTPWNNFCN